MVEGNTSDAAQVLVVAHRTAATQRLVDCVRARAEREPCRFTLLVPRTYWDPDTEAAAAVIEIAVPLLERAAGRKVQALIGDSDPVAAVESALADRRYDEIILSTLPARVSHWLRRDLAAQLERFGLPVTVVTAKGRDED